MYYLEETLETRNVRYSRILHYIDCSICRLFREREIIFQISFSLKFPALYLVSQQTTRLFSVNANSVYVVYIEFVKGRGNLVDSILAYNDIRPEFRTEAKQGFNKKKSEEIFLLAASSQKLRD